MGTVLTLLVIAGVAVGAWYLYTLNRLEHDPGFAKESAINVLNILKQNAKYAKAINTSGGRHFYIH